MRFVFWTSSTIWAISIYIFCCLLKSQRRIFKFECCVHEYTRRSLPVQNQFVTQHAYTMNLPCDRENYFSFWYFCSRIFVKSTAQHWVNVSLSLPLSRSCLFSCFFFLAKLGVHSDIREICVKNRRKMWQVLVEERRGIEKGSGFLKLLRILNQSINPIKNKHHIQYSCIYSERRYPSVLHSLQSTSVLEGNLIIDQVCSSYSARFYKL